MVGEVECRRVGREHSKGWAISSRTRICTFICLAGVKNKKVESSLLLLHLLEGRGGSDFPPLFLFDLMRIACIANVEIV